MKDYVSMGKDALDQKNFLLAQSYFEKALKFEKRSSFSLRLYMGILYKELGCFQLAFQYFEEASILDPTRSEPILGIAQIYEKTESIHLKPTLLKILENDPTNDLAHLLLAKYYEKKEQLISAIGAYFAVLNLVGDTLDVCFSLSMIYSRLGNLNYSLEFIDRALQIEPHNYKLLFNQGVLLQQLHHSEKAILSYKASLTANPNHIDSYVNLISIYCHYGYFDKALFFANRGISINPMCTLLYFNRAIIYALMSQNQKAKEDISYCLELDSCYQNIIMQHELLSTLILELKK